jgi:hypothetical protein
MIVIKVGESTAVVDRFLHAVESATIPACEAWSADATLDATVPNWRLHASGPDAIKAEYARWFADPGHFNPTFIKLVRTSAGVVDHGEGVAEVVGQGVGGGDGVRAGLDLDGAVTARGLDELPD